MESDLRQFPGHIKPSPEQPVKDIKSFAFDCQPKATASITRRANIPSLAIIFLCDSSFSRVNIATICLQIIIDASSQVSDPPRQCNYK